MTYPIRLKSKIFYIPLILASIAVSFYLLNILWGFLANFSDIFYILIIAWIITIILKPLVAYITETGINRVLAIIIAFLFLFGILGVISLFVVPSLYTELNILARNISHVNLNAYIEPVLLQLHIKNVDVSNTLAVHLDSLISYMLGNSIAFLANTVTIVFALALSFFFAFYFLYEGAEWSKYAKKIIPEQFRDDYEVITKSVTEGIQGFVKGQTIVALILALLTMIAMRVLGLNLIIVSGVYVFICMYIPVAGPVISVILPLMIAATVSINLCIVLAIILIVLIQVDVNIIQPKVFSKSLGLHPLLVILSVLVGAQLFGFLGALLALPAASIIQSLLIHYLHNTSQR